MKSLRLGVAVILILLTGCTATSVGIGGRVKAEGATEGTKVKGIEVLDVNYRESLDIAIQVIETYMTSVRGQIKNDRSGIFISNRSFWLGDVRAVIEPTIVKDTKSEDYGVVYKIRSEGVGSNPSLAPGYISDQFFEGLEKYQKENNVVSKKISDYVIINDKGITKKIRASIPSTYVGFKKYIDDKTNLLSYEGIWSSGSGEYTLGIVKDNSDPRYAYSAFVLETKKLNWKAGDIKARFTNLSKNDLVLGTYYMASKQEKSITWKVGSNNIVSVNAPGKGNIALIKVYPSKGVSGTNFSGVGTGWALTNDGVFVTNAHVIEDAQTISIGLTKDSSVSASVLLIDKRLDLALLKINNKKNYVPLSIKGASEDTGSKVLAIGYPLAFDLGSEARITNGIISAQSGVGGDVTRYHISVPVQGGNSGGPLINDRGEVVGVIVSKLVATDIDNVSFAIKSKYLVALLEQLGIKSSGTLKNEKLEDNEIYKRYKNSILPVWTN